MTRPGRPVVAVRDASEEDLPELLEMWEALRCAAGRIDRTAPVPTPEGARQRLAAVQADPLTRMVVAEVDGQVAGGALLSAQRFAPLFDVRSVHVDYLTVRPAYRRRGVGHALMSAAAAWAEECGCEHVATSVYPQLREVNRFYARLGFSPVVVRRAVPTSVLRRRLAADGTPMTPALARRRSLARAARAAMGSRAAMARVAGE